MPKERVSIDELKTVIRYDAETGLLWWTARVANNVFAGDEAGATDGQGYKHFQYKGVHYPCHQVAWAFSHGAWPKHGVDHEDADRGNNRLTNLREATQSQNSANRRLGQNNKAGLKGVRERRSSGRWEANIWLGKSVYLGTFDTKEEAHAAYVVAAKVNFGEFARAS